MADPRFFDLQGPFTLGALAALCGADLGADADPERLISDVAPLETAGGSDISFFDNRRYLAALDASAAGACVMRGSDAGQAPPKMALLLCDTPYLAYARIARAFYPSPAILPSIAPSADIDATARVGDDCRVDAYAVIGRDVRIGARCHIGAHAVIGRGVVIGDDSRIGPNVTLSHSVLGSRVRIFAGATIGEDGFGFATDGPTHVSIPQLGRVMIEDDVEIGANSTIDRGAGPDTVIGQGSRIDNLVQIGHNVALGRGCIVVAQAGISGSTVLGDFAVVAAQGGLAGHLKIGKGARVGAKAGVMRDVGDGESVLGTPAMPARGFFRGVAALKRLSEKNND